MKLSFYRNSYRNFNFSTTLPSPLSLSVLQPVTDVANFRIYSKRKGESARLPGENISRGTANFERAKLSLRVFCRDSTICIGRTKERSFSSFSFSFPLLSFERASFQSSLKARSIERLTEKFFFPKIISRVTSDPKKLTNSKIYKHSLTKLSSLQVTRILKKKKKIIILVANSCKISCIIEKTNYDYHARENYIMK